METEIERKPDNHTLRQLPWKDGQIQPKLKYEKLIEQIAKDTFVEYTTILDDEFDTVPTTLGDNNNWERVEKLLEPYKIKEGTNKQLYCDYSPRSIHTSVNKRAVHYSLPVTGSRVLNKAIQPPPFVWYVRKGDNYVKYEEFKEQEIPFENVPVYGKVKVETQKNTVGYSIVQRKQSRFSIKWNYKPSYVTPYQGTVRDVIIDFEKNIDITGMTISGKQHLIRYVSTKGTNVSNDKLDFVEVLETERHFLKQFEVWYRKHESKTWNRIDMFTTTQDRLTSKWISWPTINAQYVKIVPLSYQGSPSFMFRFYTHRKGENTEDTEKFVPACIVYPNNTDVTNKGNKVYRRKIRGSPSGGSCGHVPIRPIPDEPIEPESPKTTQLKSPKPVTLGDFLFPVIDRKEYEFIE